MIHETTCDLAVKGLRYTCTCRAAQPDPRDERLRELERRLAEEISIKEAEKKILITEIECRVAAEAERDRLAAALRKYGRHTIECPHYRGWTEVDERSNCTCGWESVLSDYGKNPTGINP